MSEEADKGLAPGEPQAAGSGPATEPAVQPAVERQPEAVATVAPVVAPPAGVPPTPTALPATMRWIPTTQANAAAEDAALRVAQKPRPLLGPALRVYGALLWSYVVFGQFTTSWIDDRPLGEGWALLGVFATTAVVAVLAVRRSVEAAPTGALGVVRRAAAAVAIALLAWFVTVTAVTLTRAFNGDLKNALVLVLLALVASIVGLRMNRDPGATEPMHGRRVLQVMIWITLVVVTLVAGAELVAVG